MSSPVRLKLSAVEDLADAFAWYETRSSGLGDELLDEVGHTVNSISRHPLGNAIAWKDIRRALVRRFPYSVFYRVTPHEIVVRAIFHNSRKPSRWKNRLRKEDD